MDDELSGKATQVRVVQGREPRHFIKMFGGKMVVFSGGKASGFKNVHDHDTYDADGTRMFRFVKYPRRITSFATLDSPCSG